MRERISDGKVESLAGSAHYKLTRIDHIDISRAKGPGFNFRRRPVTSRSILLFLLFSAAQTSAADAGDFQCRSLSRELPIIKNRCVNTPPNTSSKLFSLSNRRMQLQSTRIRMAAEVIPTPVAIEISNISCLGVSTIKAWQPPTEETHLQLLRLKKQLGSLLVRAYLVGGP